MSELGKSYIIRDYRESDKAFVMSTWLRGLYYGDSWFSLIPKDRFMSQYKLILEAIIAKPSNTILVACDIEDHDTIFGFSCLSTDFNMVHWTFVKKLFRGKGIGKSLVPQNPISVSHLTETGKALLKSKFPNTVFDPFSL